MIYLDSAAVVKLVHAEPESPALRDWLDKRAVRWGRCRCSDVIDQRSDQVTMRKTMTFSGARPDGRIREGTRPARRQ
jgi:hypothetical protein